MNRILNQLTKSLFLLGLGVTILSSCNEEPDESDLYTFTGETMESFIKADESLSSFNYVLSRVGYDDLLAAYGIYTCFAPTNEGLAAYCDSLWNDEESVIPHNGMTENSLEGLSDSLCSNIVRYHLASGIKSSVNLTGTGEILTLLGYEFSYTSDSLGRPLLNSKSTIIRSDNQVTNGVVHVVDHVIPRFTRFIGDVLQRDGRYTIFSQALKETGYDEYVKTFSRKVRESFTQLPRDNYTGILSSQEEEVDGDGTFVNVKVGFTLFAESDAVFEAAGIHSFSELVEHANDWYRNAKDWYDYLRYNGLEVKTDNDYKNPQNALNMFVAYHILGASMSENQLLFEESQTNYWNYAPDASLYDYYETLLPHTMMKVWEPDVSTKAIFINRYQTFNTLTNEVGTQGTEDMHTVEIPGVRVNRMYKLQAYNGYVIPINSVLLYSADVPDKVLHERMRVNCTSLFPELITNRYRYWAQGDGNIANTYDTSRRGFSNHYFNNLVLCDENQKLCLAYCLRGAWRCWQADQIQFWGNYDIAFKLPSVPTGLYEIRVVYAPMSYGSFMQYYIGTSPNVQSMRAIGLPFDATIAVDDPRIGMTNAKEEDDQGIASDIAMHNRSYMRGPHSYCGHGENGYSADNSARTEYGTGSYTIRYVLGREQIEQGEENWLRIKTLNSDNIRNPVGLDFVELIPVDVVDNQEYSEDWY